jgi:hypothetical protein
VAPALDRPFELAELIDLELQLVRDRDTPADALDVRDEPVARRLAQSGLTALRDRAALRTWLEHVREAGPSLGARIAELRRLAGLGLFVAGAVGGATSVGGWLLSGTVTPVNVIRFWPAVIGVQLALLVLWLLARLPQPWLGRFVPWLLGQALVSALGRGPLTRALGELRRLDWLYARLRLWLVTALTQTFALGFNLGALGALATLPHFENPAFGWRSLGLDPPQVTRFTQLAALPWQTWLPQAAPTRREVDATNYSSFQGPPSALAKDAWRIWWHFLTASLVVYGLLPRLLLWAVSQIGVAYELRRAPRAHADLERLEARLAAPHLDTRASSSELPAQPASAAAPTAWSSLPSGPLQVLCWSGVPLDDARLRAELAGAHAEVDGAIARVGVLDRAQDQRALEAVAGPGNGTSTCLIVPAWEPPVGEHLDFVRELRRALGAGRALWVLLYPLAGSAGADGAAHWRAGLQALGDPWLRVARWPEPLA